MGDNTQSLIDQSVIVATRMIVPAEKHRDASPQYVEPRLLLLGHSEAPLPETGFAAGFPARVSGRRKEHGDRHSDRG